MTQLFVVGLGLWLLGRVLPVPPAQPWVAVAGAVLVILSAVVAL